MTEFQCKLWGFPNAVFREQTIEAMGASQAAEEYAHLIDSESSDGIFNAPRVIRVGLADHRGQMTYSFFMIARTQVPAYSSSICLEQKGE